MFLRVTLLLTVTVVAAVHCNEEAGAAGAWDGDWDDYLAKVTSLVDDVRFKDDLGICSRSPDRPCPYPTIFPCNTSGFARDNRSPISVHRLRPSDIGVVAALGDSITAGSGVDACTIGGVKTQYRGFSWSVGGEVAFADNSTTVPNILKHYNADLTGYALDRGTSDQYAAARFNMAIPGSKAQDLPSQASRLVSLLKERGMEEGPWKMITVFVGGNDLCRRCNNQTVLSPDNYARHIRDTLDIFHDNLKHVFVNVVGIFNVSIIGKVRKPAVCEVLHMVICPCGVNPLQWKDTSEAAAAYNDNLQSLINSGRYDDRVDFTVVYQPFMEDADLPRFANGSADFSYMTPDCFHFSRKGHNSAGVFLWNALFEPVGSKSHVMPWDVSLYCPKPGEYLRTNQNSQIAGPAIAAVPEPGKVWRLPLYCAGVAATAVILVGLSIAAFRKYRSKQRQRKEGEMSDPLML